MKILLTGATGYIGKRLLPQLLADGHHVVCGSRDTNRFKWPAENKNQISLIQLDVLDEESLQNIPDDVDVAFYLIHSMSASRNYSEMEARSAVNFKNRMDELGVKQVIYLTGMANEEQLSTHLTSRKQVEDILSEGRFGLTALRAGIVIGSGSASFEIIRDLSEKLPIMVAPKWVNSRCQPIGIRDVLFFLTTVMGREDCYNQAFDIGSPDVLTYREMMLTYADVRGLNRYIQVVPVMTPRLSSYWLYFVTSTSYKLASSLVDSMKVNVVARDNRLAELLNYQPMSYRKSLELSLDRIRENEVVSSWKDAFVSGRLNFKLEENIEVPDYGCFKDLRECEFEDEEAVIRRIWSLGGSKGWYYGNWLWRLRGLLDKLWGGVGLRRGRTHPEELNPGDALDFWRVLYANKEKGRLILFAEMRLPGDAWLEFRIKDKRLIQTATFRPRGLMGRAYWFAVMPFHYFVFEGMLRRIARG